MLQLLNAYHQALWNSVPHYWVLLETYVQLPLELQPFISVLSYALPDRQQVQAIATQFCNQHPWLGKDDPDAKQKLLTACQGLPVGEIEMVLNRLAIAPGLLMSIKSCSRRRRTRLP
ncbi:MAG: hypothetical protein HC899_20180 [Leptolyngbyaceae cyanobacterium SM1_4_3]|nr:hypothetical protein [Leptolyngbyaceae cyanobacterium SM1_4_3]